MPNTLQDDENDPYSGYDIDTLKDAITPPAVGSPENPADMDAPADDWFSQQKAKAGQSDPEYYKKAVLAADGTHTWPKGSTVSQAADSPLPDPAMEAARNDQLEEAKKFDISEKKYKGQQALDQTLINPKTAAAMRQYKDAREAGETNAAQGEGADLAAQEVLKPDVPPNLATLPTRENLGGAHEDIANTVLSAPMTPAKQAAYAGEKYDPRKPFGNLLDDYNEQIGAMQQEKTDTTSLSKGQAKVSEAPDAVLLERAKKGEAMAQAVYEEGKKIREKGSRIVDAVLHYQFDPWRGYSPGAQAADFFAGIMIGGAHLGVNMLKKQVAENVAQQQQEVDTLKWAAGQTENLHNLFMNDSHSREQAFDKTTAVLTDVAVHQAERDLLPLKNNVTGDKIDQFIALAKQQRDIAYLRAAAHATGGAHVGASGTSQPPFVPLEKGVGTVSLRDGTTLLIHEGAAKVQEAVTNSERAIEAAQDFANFIADPKTGKTTAPFPTNYGAYQNWIAQAREKMKTLVVLASQHSGIGSQGNIARMKRYQEALAGPDADPKGAAGAVLDYPKLIAGQSHAIASAARDLADSMGADMHSILEAHGAVVGQNKIIPVAAGKRAQGGQSQLVFVPGVPTPPPIAPDQAAGGPNSPAPAPAAGVPGTVRATNNWRNYLKPAR